MKGFVQVSVDLNTYMMWFKAFNLPGGKLKAPFSFYNTEKQCK